jgi:hypothetical protein
LLDRQIKAWGAGDPDAYASVYTPKGTASASSAVTTRAARRSRRLMRFPTSFPGEPAMLPGCQRGDCAVAVRRARSRSDPSRMPNYVVGL